MAATQRHRDTVYLLDDVEKCERDVIETIMAMPDGARANVVINSGGGSVYSGLGIATLIRHKKLHCHAMVLADCSSAALLVFAACETREAADHASFLFHPVSWSGEERTRVNAARSWSAEFERVSRLTEEWLAEYLPMDRSTLKRWIAAERYVTAEEFFARGLAAPMRLHGSKVVPVVPALSSRGGASRSRRTTAAARIRRVG